MSTAAWDPAGYLRFGDERARPFTDLIAHVGAQEPRTVVDLGCGEGALTASLAQRWPGAHDRAAPGARPAGRGRRRRADRGVRRGAAYRVPAPSGRDDAAALPAGVRRRARRVSRQTTTGGRQERTPPSAPRP